MVSAEGIESTLKRKFNNIERDGRRFKLMLIHAGQHQWQVNGRWLREYSIV